MNWKLTFTGHAQDASDGENIRQQGIGSLSILEEDGSEVATFDAISGPGINGLLPNGKYRASRPIMDQNFPDENGLSYKIPLQPVGNLAAGFGRSGLLIHPTQRNWTGVENGEPRYQVCPTDGCVGLVGHYNAQSFLDAIQPYFDEHGSIDLEVDIVDNANVKIQLGSRLRYDV